MKLPFNGPAKQKWVLLCAVGLLVSALLLTVRMARSKPDSTGFGSRQSSKQEQDAIGASKARVREKRKDMDSVALDRRIRLLLDDTHKPLPASVFASYLEENRSRPEAWAACFFLTGDENLAADEDLLKSSPLGILALAYGPNGGTDLASLGEVLRDVEPGNGFADIMSFTAATRDHGPAEANELLQKLESSWGTMDLHQDELNAEMRKALLSTGMETSEIELYMLKTGRPDAKVKSMAVEGVFKLWKSSTGGKAAEEKAALVFDWINTLRAVQNSDPKMTLGLGTELQVLMGLPKDARYSDGITVGQRASELQQQIKELRAINVEPLAFLKKMEPDEVDVFFDLVNSGENETAMGYLRQRAEGRE